MSAFVVEKELIDFLLSFMASSRDAQVFVRSRTHWVRDWYAIADHATGEREIDRIGHILHAENVRSVNHRYRQDDRPDDYRFEEHGAALALQGTALAAQLVKAVDCLDYQSCETNDWEQSDAWRILQDIRARIWKTVPGFVAAYDAAKWGAPDKPAHKILSLSALAAGRAA